MVDSRVEDEEEDMTIILAKEYHAPRPNRITLFLRHSVVWQLLRFVMINIKMSLMILKSHGSRIED